MPQIEFHTQPELLDKIPHPYAASGSVPDWLKNLPTEHCGVPTIKRCPPFLQALTAGYIIPAPFDVHFVHTPLGELRHESEGDAILSHMLSQQAGTPFANIKLLKIPNPWVIKTPPGYSTLFTRPFNRFDSPIVPLTGLVETDNYYSQVNFPSLCQMPPGTTFTLARGSPLVQVIPILREAWSCVAKAVDAAQLQDTNRALSENPQLYKETSWRKLDYQ
jgi:uncharacterized protein DUF6065